MAKTAKHKAKAVSIHIGLGAVLDTAAIMAQHCRHRDRDRWVPDTSVSEGSET